jgi:hypothetical protein
MSVGTSGVRAVALGVLAAVVTCSANPAYGAVAPPSERVAGRSYVQWMVAAWQWGLSELRSHRTRRPAVLPCVTAGQRGAVWFLGHDEYTDH